MWLVLVLVLPVVAVLLKQMRPLRENLRLAVLALVSVGLLVVAALLDWLHQLGLHADEAPMSDPLNKTLLARP